MARAMGVDRGDSAPQLGRSGNKKKVLEVLSNLTDPFVCQKQVMCHISVMCLQGLLKDQLEIVKVKVNGKIKYAIQPLEEQLSFDKVGSL